MSSSTKSKATKILASYTYWNYEFNKKVRHKFRDSSKSFLSNNDSVDYAYVVSVASKSKFLHFFILITMLIALYFVLKEVFNIREYIDATAEEVIDFDLKDPNSSIMTILITLISVWFANFLYDFLKYKKAFSATEGADDADISSFRMPSRDQNICIFSGKKPFVGSGTISKNFSFVLSTDIQKKSATAELSVVDFTEDEIYNIIENALSNTYQTIQKLYINGSLINGDPNLLSAIDSGKLEHEIWQKYSERNNDSIRRYLCVTSNSQSEEINSSFFVRFVKTDNSLFVELTKTLLLPIQAKYKIIENLPRKISFTRFILMLQTSILTSFMNLGKAIFYGFVFVFTFFERFFEKSTIDKQIKENPLFDYGETSSIREDVSDTTLQTFYNAMDSEQLLKQVEKAFFNYLIHFLNSKNIDTSELVQQEATIINHGLIMSGGEINADSVTVGKKSAIFGSKKS